MSKNEANIAGYERLTQILSEAVANGADAIELEYDSGRSLGVMFISGNFGGGFMLPMEQASELIKCLWEEKRKGHGKFRIALGGKDYMVHVKTYDHFGENAYRLTVREARRKGVDEKAAQ